MWARGCRSPYAWCLTSSTLLATLASLLLPWLVPRCSVAARRCVGALVPMPRASYLPPFTQLAIAAGLTAAVADATRHGGGSLLRGRAGADVSCMGPAALHPASHHNELAAAVAGAALGGGSPLCGRAGAVHLVHGACRLPPCLPTRRACCCRGRCHAALRCLVHGAGRPSPCLPSQWACCRRGRCRAARWRLAAVWARWCRCLVHLTCRPSPSLPLLRACTAVAGATRHSGGPLLRGRAGTVRMVHDAGRPSPCLPSQWACCRRGRCPAAWWRFAAVWGSQCRCLVHLTCAALHPACHCCELVATVKGATRHGGGSLLCGRAGAVHLVHGEPDAAVADAALHGGATLSPMLRCSVAPRCCGGALATIASCMVPSTLSPICQCGEPVGAAADPALLSGWWRRSGRACACCRCRRFCAAQWRLAAARVRSCPTLRAWCLPPFALLAITVSLLPPSPLPRCTVAGGGCVGAPVPLASCVVQAAFRACRHGGLIAIDADAVLLGGCSLLVWRACADRLVHGTGRPSPCLPSRC